jgi:hypothetical protein
MLVGFVLFVHSGLSAMDYFNHLKETNSHSAFRVPMDLMVEIIFAAAIFMWGWLGSKTLHKIRTREH